MAFEELGLSQAEQDEMEASAKLAYEQDRERTRALFAESPGLQKMIELTEPHYREKLEASLYTAAADLSIAYGVTMEEAMKLISERATSKWGKE